MEENCENCGRAISVEYECESCLAQFYTCQCGFSVQHTCRETMVHRIPREEER